MITITIDHNSDEIRVTNDTFFPNTGKLRYPVKHPYEFQKFLIELLNVMDLSEVILEEINEDRRRTVAEW